MPCTSQEQLRKKSYMNRGGDTGRHAGGRAAVCSPLPHAPRTHAPPPGTCPEPGCGAHLWAPGRRGPRPDPLTPRSHRLCLPPGSSLGASARSGPAAERRSPRCAAIVAAPGVPHPHLSILRAEQRGGPEAAAPSAGRAG